MMTSRFRSSTAARSTAQNSSGMNAATRVCGQFDQATMKPDAEYTSAAIGHPARGTPQRRSSSDMPTVTTTISRSFTAPGAYASGRIHHGRDSGDHAPESGMPPSSVPPAT
uniref:Uncharacterized protein n=1 Tax=Neobacillus citreus TaxID=2833578 RepID=A0A942YDV7_9BACI